MSLVAAIAVAARFLLKNKKNILDSKPQSRLEGWLSPVAAIAAAASFLLKNKKNIRFQTQKSFGGLVEPCSSHSNDSKIFTQK